MRYHHTNPDFISRNRYGVTMVECKSPIYSECTLYTTSDLSKGLAIIQQYYDPSTKQTRWAEIEAPLVNELYLNEKFHDMFKEFAGERDKQNIYPTITIRQAMHFLGMKPLKREPWETDFPRKPI